MPHGLTSRNTPPRRYGLLQNVLLVVDQAGPIRVAFLIRLGPAPFTIENYGASSSLWL